MAGRHAQVDDVAGVARAVCPGCLWEGRRTWPSPPRPCPRCGRDVLRQPPGTTWTSRRDKGLTAWDDEG